jgi:2-amino-4-hydroxy-6-hydroxymethyldihydropteridine diphosphokinase
MGRAYIGLGSNLGDGRRNLLEAWRRLAAQPGIVCLALSSPFLSKPLVKPEWLAAGHKVSGGMFTNAVGLIESRPLARELLAVMQEIELLMGRDRAQTVDRVIDLDLLYYDDLTLAGGDLLLPHPELPFRRFVLEPLAELAPGLCHPLLGLTSSQMLQRLVASDAEELQRLEWLEEVIP